MTAKLVKQTSMSTYDEEYSLYKNSLGSSLSKTYNLQRAETMGKEENLISSIIT